MSAQLVWFEVTVPLIRKSGGSLVEQRDVVLRIPSNDLPSATTAAQEIAWTVVEHLPKEPDNNRTGWKLANWGVAVEPVTEDV